MLATIFHGQANCLLIALIKICESNQLELLCPFSRIAFVWAMLFEQAPKKVREYRSKVLFVISQDTGHLPLLLASLGFPSIPTIYVEFKNSVKGVGPLPIFDRDDVRSGLTFPITRHIFPVRQWGDRELNGQYPGL